LEQLYPLSDFSGAFFDSDFFSSPILQVIAAAQNVSVSDNSEYWRSQQIYGDYLFNCPTYYQAYAFSEHGMPVYKLAFDAGTQLHGASAPYLTVAPSESSNTELASKMQDYWMSFAATLDPNAISLSNGSSSAPWPLYTGGNGTEFVELQVTENATSVRSDRDANARCEFFFGRSGVVWN
jgi:carboxylesterase type B